MKRALLTLACLFSMNALATAHVVITRFDGDLMLTTQMKDLEYPANGKDNSVTVALPDGASCKAKLIGISNDQSEGVVSMDLSAPGLPLVKSDAIIGLTLSWAPSVRIQAYQCNVMPF